MLEIVESWCPYCGEAIELVIDGSVASQEYIEDCQVCCRPMQLAVSISMSGSIQVDISRDDD